MRSRWPLFATLAALVAATLALAALRDGADRHDEPDDAALQTVAAEEDVVQPVAVEEHVVIELRVWQHVDNSDDVRLSARARGGDWVTLAGYQTIPFALYREESDSWGAPRHDYRNLSITGVDLRFWQRHRAPEVVYVRACVVACSGLDGSRDPYWAPLGMVRVALDDGYGPFGIYRHGALTLAVPVANPGLRADREYLLALRDALAGTAELNWSASTPTGEWEGVTLSETPPRVTGLDLANRELDGEVLGWLGDLTGLRELRLDGNRLTGALPTKLAALRQLTHVYLAGNDFSGCVAPPLRSVAHGDLALLLLPDCDPPALLLGSTTRRDLLYQLGYGSPIAAGTYRWSSDRGVDYVMEVPAGAPSRVFDLRPRWSDSQCHHVDPCGITLLLLRDTDPARELIWIALDIHTAQELLRSKYLEEDAELFAIIERIAASVWVLYEHTADDAELVWP